MVTLTTASYKTTFWSLGRNWLILCYSSGFHEIIYFVHRHYCHTSHNGDLLIYTRLYCIVWPCLNNELSKSPGAYYLATTNLQADHSLWTVRGMNRTSEKSKYQNFFVKHEHCSMLIHLRLPVSYISTCFRWQCGNMLKIMPLATGIKIIKSLHRSKRTLMWIPMYRDWLVQNFLASDWFKFIGSSENCKIMYIDIVFGIVNCLSFNLTVNVTSSHHLSTSELIWESSKNVSQNSWVLV